MIKRPLLHRDGHLRGLGQSVDVVRKIRVPIAKAVRRIGKPLEVAVGASPQGFFGSWELVLERLQFGDLIEQTSKFAVFGSGNLGAVIHIGTRDSTKDQ